MKPVFTADEKWCLYINIKRSPPWVDEAKQREPQPRADFHPLKTLSNAFQGKPGDDEDDLDRWLSKFFESIPV
ncbi:hypothetical protein Y032_0473g2106 [Ancylostoma ceylanicum]|uniref:Transposase n=1 Tax=Ancylostoma ceylanicum TaxID=53326 RepID=A0A016WYJ8_9BILA|nr:hypothetical protein Y032_0473g2106 [Ancylostoma ceylanicum]